MKKRIFIGSSSESIRIAEQVKEYFEEKYDCVIWNDNFFDLNRSIYENLLKKSIAFDYAIFIAGKDDFVLRKSTKKAKYAPRDNVYLEFGLFAGILSPARTFFIINGACKIATDLKGINISKFRSATDVEYCCKSVERKLQEEDKIFRTRLLPSVSLAIGYYENFLKEVCYAIANTKTIELDGQTIDISKCKKQIKVLIPKNVTSDWKSILDVYYSKKRMEDFAVKGTREFGVKLEHCKLYDVPRQFVVVDLPQTLRSSFKTIDFLVSKDYIGESDFLELAKQKEVDNFVEAIKALAASDALVSDMLVVESI